MVHKEITELSLLDVVFQVIKYWNTFPGDQGVAFAFELEIAS